MLRIVNLVMETIRESLRKNARNFIKTSQYFWQTVDLVDGVSLLI